MPGASTLSDTDLCNMALSHLGISIQIQSLTEDSKAARTLNFWYPKLRDAATQSAPWNWAYTNIILAQELVNPNPNIVALPGWPYSYQYPIDCLQPIAVTNLAGQRLGPMFWQNWWWPWPTGFSYGLPKIPFRTTESQANPGQLAIVCDVLSTAQSPLYLFYIKQVTNTALFDPLFCEYLAYKIGANAGTPLRASMDKVQMCAQQENVKRLEALAQHLNASQQDYERDSPSVIARM